MKNKRSLILASGILFIISAVSYILLSLIVATSIDGIVQIIGVELSELVEVGELTTEYVNYIMNLINTLIWVGVGILLAFAVVDMVLGILLVKHSKKNDEIVARKKGLVITSLVFSFICGGIVSAILLILALCTKVNLDENKQVVEPVAPAVSNGETKEMSNMERELTQPKQPEQKTVVNDKYAEKIRKLQNLRDSGAITKEEYDKLLSQVFED